MTKHRKTKSNKNNDENDNSGLENDVLSSSYSSRIAHLYIDWCAEAEVRLVSNNKTIYIPKWTNNFAISTILFDCSIL